MRAGSKEARAPKRPAALSRRSSRLLPTTTTRRFHHRSFMPRADLPMPSAKSAMPFDCSLVCDRKSPLSSETDTLASRQTRYQLTGPTLELDPAAHAPRGARTLDTAPCTSRRSPRSTRARPPPRGAIHASTRPAALRHRRTLRAQHAPLDPTLARNPARPTLTFRRASRALSWAA